MDTERCLEPALAVPALAVPALELSMLLPSDREEPGKLINIRDKQGNPRERIVQPQLKSSGAKKLCST